MQNSIDSTYLRFTPSALAEHFAVAAGGSAAHVRYFEQSAERYRSYLETHPDRRGIPISQAKAGCQVEKDEKFWIADTLMTMYRDPRRVTLLGKLLATTFGDVPPVEGLDSWDDCLDGNLSLFFEPNLPSPPSYKRWLVQHLDERHPVVYVRHSARKSCSDEMRLSLEGATNVDAMLVNADNGFSVLFEAKVLSDASYQVSFDALRNQIARNIDVMLDENRELTFPLNRRRADRSLFTLLTPGVFRDYPQSRLFGWLMNEYRENAEALARDLPHRTATDFFEVSKRLGWLTFEDCRTVQPSACPWLSL